MDFRWEFFFPKQEFDNYAEWDLRDIDFVEDDSDILHGNILLQPMFLLIANCDDTVLGARNIRMNKTCLLPLMGLKLQWLSC